jgi:large subunit ribosomal protein L29e
MAGLSEMAKRSNTSAHNRSHQQHRNGIKKAGVVPLWFPKGMNSRFLRNVKFAKLGVEKKKKADAKAKASAKAKK